jgi:hypothetical protein
MPGPGKKKPGAKRSNLPPSATGSRITGLDKPGDHAPPAPEKPSEARVDLGF